LYPALHRLEARGSIASAWELSEAGKRAKYYRLTPQGRKQLQAEQTKWETFARAMGLDTRATWGWNVARAGAGRARRNSPAVFGGALAGTAAGFVGALPLSKLMARMLYAVRPTDPVTFGSVAVVLGVAALLASCVPARKATRIEPMVALRSE
jgi:DNA-binding MarR family transcriptional regulator